MKQRESQEEEAVEKDEDDKRGKRSMSTTSRSQRMTLVRQVIIIPCNVVENSVEFENSMKEALKVQEALRDSGKKEMVQEFIEVGNQRVC